MWGTWGSVGECGGCGGMWGCRKKGSGKGGVRERMCEKKECVKAEGGGGREVVWEGGVQKETGCGKGERGEDRSWRRGKIERRRKNRQKKDGRNKGIKNEKKNVIFSLSLMNHMQTDAGNVTKHGKKEKKTQIKKIRKWKKRKNNNKEKKQKLCYNNNINNNKKTSSLQTTIATQSLILLVSPP